MLQYIKETYTLYDSKGKEVDNFQTRFIDEEENCFDYTLPVNWLNIDKIVEDFGNILNIFLYDKGKNGRYVRIFPTGRAIKEKRNDTLAFTIKVKCEILNPSIQTILNYSDGEKAFQYLRERSLQIIEKEK